MEERERGKEETEMPGPRHMPDIVIMTSLGRRGSAARERWSLSGVVFTEVALANIEAKKGVERELPFKAVYAKNLEAIQ